MVKLRRGGEVYRVLERGYMKKTIVLLLCLGLCSCATSYKINSVSLGMSKGDVIKTMGNPISTSAIDGTEYLNYELSETNFSAYQGSTKPYYVCIRDGKVISYGRTGDFDSTKDPTQVIKILGDVKTEEKINVKTESNGELEQKLKTLNKLLADGLITKTEFEEQKKKMLNDYTSK